MHSRNHSVMSSMVTAFEDSKGGQVSSTTIVPGFFTFLYSESKLVGHGQKRVIRVGFGCAPQVLVF